MTTPDETWYVGEAARYLNGGGIDFGIDGRRVRRWADNPECQIRAVGAGRGRWRRVLASTVRAERARLLAEAGRVDPGWPGGQPGLAAEERVPPDRE
jgi:hypothetical protein